VLALLVVIAMSVAGCTGEHDGLSGQYRNGDTKNYISGNGAVTEFRAADRGPAVDFSARDLDAARHHIAVGDRDLPRTARGRPCDGAPLDAR